MKAFPALRMAGGMVPSDLFDRLLAPDSDLPHRDPASYGLAPTESVREVASRAFTELLGVWQAFARERERAGGRATAALTRDRWQRRLLDRLGYGVLSATPAGGITVDGAGFPVTHQWQHLPIHLLGWDIDLDRRTRGVPGAAGAAPQSMVQELLNRTDDHLWALLCNGQRLRLLRDSRALAGSAYVEFDLEQIFDEELFSDWVLLYRLLHATRFAVDPEQTPDACIVEGWRVTAVAQGERALQRLEVGARQAISALGSGFLRHPANAALRERLGTGELDKQDYYRSVLRLVYRLLFWFVAEDREVLLDPAAPALAQDRYHRYFSARRLRARARRGAAAGHDDLWEATRLVFAALGTGRLHDSLALPGIGGLFERLDDDLPDALDEPLEGLRLGNRDLLTAVRALAEVRSDGPPRPVDFRNLGAEELGSVYEGLLELHPDPDTETRTFELVAAAGNERRETGSYYTPRSLAEALLDSALDPVLDDAAAGPDPETRVEALLRVTVCDPACGSGHFLVVAARRIARRVAQQRSGDEEPSPDLVRAAMREVVSRCIHGVDINEMAAELAKVSLWLESVEPGRPLPFLEATIRVGNTLLGATPALIADGVPKEAFEALDGDKDSAKIVAKFSAETGAGGQLDIFADHHQELSNVRLGAATRELVTRLPERLADVAVQRKRLREIDGGRLGAKRAADAWCATFVQELTPATAANPITESTLDWVGNGPTTLAQSEVADRVERLTREYRFFHWHVEFPHIFPVDEGTDPNTGWSGGFSCVLGNPPWERVKLQDQEFFAVRRPEIAQARNKAARDRLILQLAASDDPVDRTLIAEYRREIRKAAGWSHLLRAGGRYPLTGRGDINTYSVFAETGRAILSPRGRVGLVLPTGIATDATTQYFFKDLVTTRTLVSIYDFENEEKLFPAVDHRVRFALWTASGRDAPQDRIDLAFRLRQVPQLAERRFQLTPDDIIRLNPNTGTCPVFDYRRNADITVEIYRRVPVLWRDEPDENPWDLSFQAMLHMSGDSGLFKSRDTLEEGGWELSGNIFVRNGERMLPLFEAKMVHHFDDRFGTYQGQTQAQANVGTLPRPDPSHKDDPSFAVLPRYWVAESEVEDRLARRSWHREWLLGWRDICRSSDTRTLLASVLPRTATPDGTLLMLPGEGPSAGLLANLCSFAIDYVARQKSGGTHLKYFTIKQLPVLPPEPYDQPCPWDSAQQLGDWVTARVLELSYTSYDMESFARDHGDTGPPFRWDEDRRFAIRTELDAAYFHLYGLPRDDVDYVLDTFRAFRNNDPDRFARTKTAILTAYAAMAAAIDHSTPYRSPIEPLPGHGPRHPARPRGADHG